MERRARLRSVPPAVLAALLLLSGLALGQDLEPRRWTHLPVGLDVLGLSYARTTGDLAFDPVLLIDDARVETHREILSYVHSFGLGDRAARLDLLVPYQQSRWKGTLDGAPAQVRRTGFADPRIRLSVNLLGSPALGGAEFQAFQESHPINTVVGAALAVNLPLGEYREDKLLNVGQNRYTFRPQLGAVHTRGPWSYELTGSTAFFTDNHEFFGGTELEQDPLYELQAHVVRLLGQGWWVASGAGYSWSGESKVDGVRKNDRRGDLVYGASFGFPLGKTQGISLAYIRNDTQRDVGSDSDTVVAGWSVRF